jgi:hypothetical protein
VNRKKLVSLTVAVTCGLSALATTGPVMAFNFGDMMNPTRWFDSDRDRDRGRYYDYDRYYGGYGPYGYRGGPGGGYGPWGGGYGPWGGGYGPWGGWGGYPGYGPGSTIVVTPQSGGSSDKPDSPRLPE